MAAQLYYALSSVTECEQMSIQPPFAERAFCPECSSDDIRHDSHIISSCRNCGYEGKYDEFLSLPVFNEEDFS